jgi:hypothetical protein
VPGSINSRSSNGESVASSLDSSSHSEWTSGCFKEAF